MLSVNPVGVISLVPLGLYFTSVFAVTGRLKAAYPQKWNKLGQPSPLHLSPLNAHRLVRYLFFSRNVTGHDPALGRWIWSTRVLLAVCLAMFVWAVLTPPMVWPD